MSICCNQNCNQGRDCPLTVTSNDHKDKEANDTAAELEAQLSQFGELQNALERIAELDHIADDLQALCDSQAMQLSKLESELTNMTDLWNIAHSERSAAMIQTAELEAHLESIGESVKSRPVAGVHTDAEPMTQDAAPLPVIVPAQVPQIPLTEKQINEFEKNCELLKWYFRVNGNTSPMPRKGMKVFLAVEAAVHEKQRSKS